MNAENDIKGKLMVVPEDTVEAIHYFGDNNKLEAIGILRNQWNDDKSHSYSSWIELPLFSEMYRGLESRSINTFISNFLRGHHKTHDNKMIKVTIEVMDKPKP